MYIENVLDKGTELRRSGMYITESMDQEYSHEIKQAHSLLNTQPAL